MSGKHIRSGPPGKKRRGKKGNISYPSFADRGKEGEKKARYKSLTSLLGRERKSRKSGKGKKE